MGVKSFAAGHLVKIINRKNFNSQQVVLRLLKIYFKEHNVSSKHKIHFPSCVSYLWIFTRIIIDNTNLSLFCSNKKSHWIELQVAVKLIRQRKKIIILIIIKTIKLQFKSSTIPLSSVIGCHNIKTSQQNFKLS